MPLKTQYSRQLLKRTVELGETPFVTTGSTDHLDGTWVKNQIYPGELFLNMADRKLYYGYQTISGSGIVQVASTTDITGSTSGGNYLPLSGGTVTGNTNFTQGLTATTISATTYQNLPDNSIGKYLPISGGTVTGNTTFSQGVTATTISATTYQNLPTDIRVTGGTYLTGTTTFTNNTGGTFSVSGYTDKQTLIMDSGTYAVSNTSAETIVRAVEITPNKWKNLAAYDLKILGQHQAPGTVTNTIRCYLNTGSTLDGGQVLIHEGYNTSNNTATANNGTTIGIIKTLWKDGDVLTYDRGNSGANLANVLGSVDVGVVNNTYQRNVFDTTFTFSGSLYLITTCQMSTVSPSHITRIKKIYLVEV